MADEIVTNGVLLGHIQAIHGELLTTKRDLQQQISQLDQRLTQLDQKVTRGFEDANRRFEEARQHRQSLQEDLDATIRMVGKHEVKLARR